MPCDAAPTPALATPETPAATPAAPVEPDEDLPRLYAELAPPAIDEPALTADPAALPASFAPAPTALAAATVPKPKRQIKQAIALAALEIIFSLGCGL